jgi:hypothetical protein
MPNTATQRAPKLYTIPAGTPVVRCKGSFMGGSCSAVVYWITDANGQRRIIDADVEGGKRPSETKDTGQLDMLTGGEAPVFDGVGVDHHATCPDVALFRRGRE